MGMALYTRGAVVWWLARWTFDLAIGGSSLVSAPPRQNAVRMSNELSLRSVTHFRLRNEIIGKQIKPPHRKVQNQKVRRRQKR